MPERSSRRTVLVVEDDAAIRELLRLHLDLAGFTIDEADDGRRGLDRARSTPFDVILLDVMLPGLDGVSLCTGRQISATQLSRRAAFGAIGAAAAAVAAACGDSQTSPSSVDTTSGSTTTSTNATCAVTPNETAGPYPSRTDMFRSDIRENRSGTALTLTVKVVNVNNGCAVVSGADVEIWHCDAAGDYSQYGSQTAATFLRGIQTTNAAGEVTFTTIYPGWYQGRATHIHAEVTMSGRSIKVTQMAFPETVNNSVHATGLYASRGTNPMSNASDGIFADSLASEIVTPTGSPTGGYAATFQIGIAI